MVEQHVIFRFVFHCLFLKLSGVSGFWTNLRKTDRRLHKLAVNYQRQMRKLHRCELDIIFLRTCRDKDIFPKFLRWRHLNKLNFIQE